MPISLAIAYLYIAVQFLLTLDMVIAGLVGTQHTATQVSDAPCPIQLPINSV